jgi:hypothetical protein
MGDQESTGQDQTTPKPYAFTEQELKLQAAQGKKADAGAELQARLDQLQAGQQELTKRLEAEQTGHQQTQAQWHRAEAYRHLADLAATAGAAKSALPDIPKLFPQQQVRVQQPENGGLPQVQIVDPVTEQVLDGGEAMKAWLESKPHLKEAPARGAGLPAGKPAQTGPKDKLDGLSSSQAMAVALKELEGSG